MTVCADEVAVGSGLRDLRTTNTITARRIELTSMDKLERVTGTWRGVYSYDPSALIPGLSVPFTLTLEQGWFGRFTGTVMDDAPPGMPGTGRVQGYFSFPKIEFTKRMPVCYVVTPDRRLITLREYLVESGHSCEGDFRHMPIWYEGRFLSPTEAQGTWTLKAGLLSLGDGRAVEFGESTGGWTIQLRAA